jgi:hypothetical protein
MLAAQRCTGLQTIAETLAEDVDGDRGAGSGPFRGWRHVASPLAVWLGNH